MKNHTFIFGLLLTVMLVSCKQKMFSVSTEAGTFEYTKDQEAQASQQMKIKLKEVESRLADANLSKKLDAHTVDQVNSEGLLENEIIDYNQAVIKYNDFYDAALLLKGVKLSDSTYQLTDE